MILPLPARPGLCSLRFPDAQVAQLVEQRTENPRVGGSTPSLGTKETTESTGFTMKSGELPYRQVTLIVWLGPEQVEVFAPPQFGLPKPRWMHGRAM